MAARTWQLNERLYTPHIPTEICNVIEVIGPDDTFPGGHPGPGIRVVSDRSHTYLNPPATGTLDEAQHIIPNPDRSPLAPAWIPAPAPVAMATINVEQLLTDIDLELRVHGGQCHHQKNRAAILTRLRAKITG